MSTVTLPLELVERLTKWRLCMSYNDSYFGEPEGELKRLAEEIERAAQPAAPTQLGEPVTWRDAIKSYPSPDMTLAPQPSQPVEAGEATNAVTIDRRDLFDFVRGGIKSALEDGNAGEGMVASWYWQEATERAERVLGNLGVFGASTKSAVVLDDERAADSKDDPLPRPSVHAAVHYAQWLRRKAHQRNRLKADVMRNAASMIDVLNAECRRLHQELIDQVANDSRALDSQDERAALLADHIELNMCNYDPDDVASLNAWAIHAHDFIERAASPQVTATQPAQTQPAQTERALTLPDRLEVPAVTFGLSRRYALGWNDCLDAIGAAQPAAGGDRG